MKGKDWRKCPCKGRYEGVFDCCQICFTVRWDVELRRQVRYVDVSAKDSSEPIWHARAVGTGCTGGPTKEVAFQDKKNVANRRNGLSA